MPEKLLEENAYIFMNNMDETMESFFRRGRREGLDEEAFTEIIFNFLSDSGKEVSGI